jgi:thiol:disulfide interchange protein DsbC
MRRYSRGLAVRLALSLVVLTAGGSVVVAKPIAPKSDDPVAARIKNTLHQRFPDVQVVSVSAAGVSGLYEVVTAVDIVYTDASAEHLITGRIVDTKTRLDLTAQRWDALHSIDFALLPLDLAIKEVRGDGSRKLAIFEDPHCPFCEQLERDTQSLTNVTVYRFLFPLEDLHPGAQTTAARIWCSADPAAAWNAWMNGRTEPTAQACESYPGKRLSDLGKELGVKGTPTMFVQNGRRLFGATTTEKIESLLASSHP